MIVESLDCILYYMSITTSYVQEMHAVLAHDEMDFYTNLANNKQALKKDISVFAENHTRMIEYYPLIMPQPDQLDGLGHLYVSCNSLKNP